MDSNTDTGKEEILFDGKDVRLVIHRSTSKKALLTFTVRPQPGKPLTGFAARFVQDQELTGIYVIAKWPHWWQTPEMRQIVDAIRDTGIITGADASLAYGASMGACGVMQFAARVGCRRALLIAPQISVDPTIVPFEHRWDEDIPSINFEEPDARSGLSAECHYTIVFDPCDRLDAEHIALLPDVPNVQLIRIPFGGHTLPELLLQTRALKSLVMSTLEGTFDPISFRRQVRLGRVSSPHYFDMLSRYALAKGRASLAYRAARCWLKLSPTSKDAFGRAVKALRDTPAGSQLALALAKEYVLISPTEIAGWRTLRLAAYQSNDMQTAYHACWSAVQLPTAVADDWRWCVRVGLRIGDQEKAWSTFLKVRDKFPNDLPLFRVGIQAALALGEFTKALTVAERVAMSSAATAEDIKIYNQIQSKIQQNLSANH